MICSILLLFFASTLLLCAQPAPVDSMRGMLAGDTSRLWVSYKVGTKKRDVVPIRHVVRYWSSGRYDAKYYPSYSDTACVRSSGQWRVSDDGKTLVSWQSTPNGSDTVIYTIDWVMDQWLSVSFLRSSRRRRVPENERLRIVYQRFEQEPVRDDRPVLVPPKRRWPRR